MRHSPLASRRAAIYQWFSQQLFQELSEAQLVTLGGQESRGWIASLSAIPGLASDVKRFERSLTRVLQRTARAQERRQMNALLVEQELAPRENEASDHIAIQLALMAEQVNREAPAATQCYFLQHHILCWAPFFMASCQQREAEGFYVLAVVMMVNFMREDARYLETLRMDDVDPRRH